MHPVDPAGMMYAVLVVIVFFAMIWPSDGDAAGGVYVHA